MSFEEIFDLTARVYFHFYSIQQTIRQDKNGIPEHMWLTFSRSMYSDKTNYKRVLTKVRALQHTAVQAVRVSYSTCTGIRQ